MTQIKSISKLFLLFVIVMISCNEKEMNVVVSEEKASINSIEFEYMALFLIHKFQIIKLLLIDFCHMEQQK